MRGAGRSRAGMARGLRGLRPCWRHGYADSWAGPSAVGIRRACGGPGDPASAIALAWLRCSCSAPFFLQYGSAGGARVAARSRIASARLSRFRTRE